MGFGCGLHELKRRTQSIAQVVRIVTHDIKTAALFWSVQGKTRVPAYSETSSLPPAVFPDIPATSVLVSHSP